MRDFLWRGPAALLFSALVCVKSYAEEDLRYGQIFFLESSELELPRFSLGVGYAKDLNNSFFDLHSLAASAQLRLWKYLSTGIWGQWVWSDLTSSGASLNDLQRNLDIQFEARVPRWGVFSLTQFQFMIGKWNVLNLFPIQVDVLLGGGFGALGTKMRLSQKNSILPSPLWAVEQRVYILDRGGVHVSFVGHRGAVFVSPGLVYRF